MAVFTLDQGNFSPKPIQETERSRHKRRRTISMPSEAKFPQSRQPELLSEDVDAGSETGLTRTLETAYGMNATKPGQQVSIERQHEEQEPHVRGIVDSWQDKESSKPIIRDQGTFISGEIRPPLNPTTRSAVTGFHAFMKWASTPFGFSILIYGLNVVAWGGMLFLLLCNASPAMCWAPVPSAEANIHRAPAAALQWLSTQPRVFNCSSVNSPRRIWIEIDSQILNALFCVTGFGLLPWRLRDLYYLLHHRFTSKRRSGLEQKMYGLRVLAGIHCTWFRLPGSSTLDQMSLAEYEQTLGLSITDSPRAEIRVPLWSNEAADNTLTGARAPATATWKMDFFVWCNIWNTLFQVGLCVFMWRLNRYNRPSWATGLFIALACIVAGAAGIMKFVEGKKVTRAETSSPC